MNVSATSFPATWLARAQRKTGSAARPKRPFIGDPSRLRFALTLLIAAPLLTGCFSVLPPLSDAPSSPDTPAPDATASLFVTIQAAELLSEPAGFRAPETARVTLEKSRSGSNQVPKLQREATVHDGPMVFQFDRIETGRWSITAELLDTDGVLMYTGKSEAYVRDQETASIELVLEMLPGVLEVQIDLGDQCIEIGEPGACLADVADRGHVKLAPNSDNHNFDWTPGDIEGATSVSRLVPGDYEFQLVFYKGSRLTGNTLYESHWIPFRIEPGHTTTVHWRPEAGALQVTMRFPEPPAPPTDLTASWTEDGVQLTWTGSMAPDISHYNVWRKNEPTEPITSAHATNAPHTTDWLDTAVSPDLCEPRLLRGLAYVVTAVNENGMESLRSNEVDACALIY